MAANSLRNGTKFAYGIGSTAESVLGDIDCSVLTVKPDGFVSPIALDDAEHTVRERPPVAAVS